MDFILRKWQAEDAKAVAVYANNKKIADNLRNAFPHPYTARDAENYVNHCIQNEGPAQVCRCIVINEEPVGSIGIFLKDDVYCKSAEIGYWLGEPFWGRGIMSGAVQQLCSFVFDNYELCRIFAEPFALNTGSRKVLEKAGFVLEGIQKNSVYKNGMLQDSCIYALLK